MQRFLQRVADGHDLSASEAEAAMDLIMTGEATPAQIAGYLIALRCKGETIEEIAGSARAMRAHATPVGTRRRGLIDTCGTGGDGKQTLNISTAAAIVVAAADVPVAKHGNRSVSSRSGSADVLEALGVHIDLPPSAVQQTLDQIGIGFMFAPRFHQAMRHAVGPRKELGLRTIFNVLGPLTNPAGAEYQLLGVYDRRLVEPIAHVLIELGVRRALVVHGEPGLDEISISGETHAALVDQGKVVMRTITPADLSLQEAPVSAIGGGDPQQNAALIRAVFSDQPGPHRDAVVANAAGALFAAGKVASLAEGVALAQELIRSGAALAKLEAWVALSQRLAAAERMPAS